MKILSTDYMQRFRCLAQDCEDNCCKRWTVRLNKKHYEGIQDLGSRHTEIQSSINKYIQISQEPTDTQHYASIDMNEEGYCPFLDNQKLCQLQTLGNIETLGNTCANYPRVIYQIDNTLEVMGALSCPEVTRLCFRSSALAELQPIDSASLPREDYTVTHHIDTQQASYYESCFPKIRNEFMNLALNPAYTSKQKLYLLCYLSKRLSSYYNNDCDSSIESMLKHELNRFSGTEIIENLLQTLSNYEDHNKDGLITVQSIFSIRIQHYQQDPLTPYINDIIESYRNETPFEMEIESLASTYVKRKKTIIPQVHAQLEEYLSRHLQNCLLREWFLRFPDPFNYMQMLTLRQAMIRFLLYSHPSFQQWCETDIEHDDEVLHKVIEELSVEIFYLFSRSIEHDIDFLQNVYSALISEEMMNLDTSLALLKGL